MKIITGLENVEKFSTGSVTVGSFDGLHLGHQRILQQMRKLEGPVTVLTFHPHPQSIVRPDKQTPPLLTSYAERVQLFSKIGVDRLIITKFDHRFAEISPEEFVTDVLVKKIGMTSIFVGPRHRFGEGRKGDVKLLEKLGEEHKFEVNVIEPVNRFGEIISSSRVRKLLLDGDVLTSWRCLGRPYYYTGQVVHGDGRGKKLNIPTANIESDEPAKIAPPPGVYASVVEIGSIRWPSVSHFGPRPTFKGALPSVETHIIGFKGNIYGHQIQIGLIDYLRDTKAFPNPTELFHQMARDLKESIQRLAELGFGFKARLRIQRYGKIIA